MGGAGFSYLRGTKCVTKNRYQLAVLGYVGAAAFISTTASAQSADATRSGEGRARKSKKSSSRGFRASLQNSVGRQARQHRVLGFDLCRRHRQVPRPQSRRIAAAHSRRADRARLHRRRHSVAVRGLGRDFTQITLNGAPVETASDSNIDNVSQGRGIDLVLFPTELFRQLTVSKTPTAEPAGRRGCREHRPAHRAAVRRERVPRQLQRQGQLTRNRRRVEPAPRVLREQHLGHRHGRIRHPRRRRLFESQVPLRWIQHHRLHDRLARQPLPVRHRSAVQQLRHA